MSGKAIQWFEDVLIDRSVHAVTAETFLTLCSLPQDVMLSFNARRNGKLKVCQKLDVLGLIPQRDGSQETEDIAPLKLGCIHTITLKLSAVCCSQTVQLPPKLNPGTADIQGETL